MQFRSRFTSRFRSRYSGKLGLPEAVRTATGGIAPGIAAPSVTITGGTTDTPLQPELNTSAYSTVGGNAEAHASTDWEIATDSAFSNVVWSAPASASLTQITVGMALEDNTQYYARARHNSASYISDWSATVPFTTINVFVTTPSVTSPTDGATDIGETPTITSSAFAVTGGSDTHASSSWQVASDSGFSTIVAQSLNDASNLTSWTTPALSTSTTYYVRVLHTGTNEGASAYSSTVSFTTAAAFTDPDAQAWIDQMSTAPNATYEAAYDNFVKDLKTGPTHGTNVWTALDAVYVLAAHAAQAAHLNAKDPTGTALTPVNSPTFTAGQGYTGDGTSAYLDTGMAPSGLSNWSQNSACLGVYIRSAASGGNDHFLGVIDSLNNSATIRTNAAGTASPYEVNANRAVGNYVATTTASSSTGLLVANRSGASAQQVYFDGALEGSDSGASVAPPTLNLFLLALNSSGSAVVHAAAQLSVAIFGSSLTANQHADLDAAVDNLKTAIGF